MFGGKHWTVNGGLLLRVESAAGGGAPSATADGPPPVGHLACAAGSRGWNPLLEAGRQKAGLRRLGIESKGSRVFSSLQRP